MIDNVISAYEAVKMNGVSQGIIALCSFIAVIIVIQKFVTAWKEAFSEGDKPVDMNSHCLRQPMEREVGVRLI